MKMRDASYYTVKSKMTPIMSKAYSLALRLGLTYPAGRAAYVANRHANGGLKGRNDKQILLSVRPETAKAWERHWLQGGSLKAMRYTAVEWNRLRREREAEIRAHVKSVSPTT
jgi:hypothetical protein